MRKQQHLLHQHQFLNFNTQLSTIQRQIFSIQQNYKQSQNVYNNKIKYRIKQIVNTVSNNMEFPDDVESIQNSKLIDQNRRDEFRKVTQKENIRHKILDEQFNQLFMQGFINNELKNVVENGLFINKMLQNQQKQCFGDNYKARQTSEMYKYEKQIVNVYKYSNDNKDVKKIKDIGLQNQQIRFHQIALQLQKQKHSNNSLMRQIQLLQRQQQSLNNYCQLPHDEIRQNDDGGDSTKDGNIQYQQDGLDEDGQLGQQLELLKRLVKSKSAITKQLQLKNHALRMQNNELRSKQVYLQKKKMLLQCEKRPKLQKKVSQLINQVKQIIKENQTKKPNEQNQNQRQKQTKIQLNSALKQITQIKQMINQQLQERCIRQERQYIQEQTK